MHQSVVEYDVAPTAMTRVAAVGDPDGWLRSRTAPFAAYLMAASIAAGLLAAWAGLCAI